MNRTFVLALAAGLASSTLAVAQAPATPAAPAAAVKPEAVNAKVAIIAFEQAVVATNEGQKVFAELQKKYQPQQDKLQAQAAEIESLKKQLQALPASAPDEERASRTRAIDTKQKDLQRAGEDAQSAYNGDVQDALGKLSQKVGAVATKYAQDNGFTLLLNYPDPRQQVPNQILWFQQTSDITEAVVNAYNTSSGVAAPAPSAPTPHRSTAPAAKH
jgi:outer membrane protein